jgi:bifunctional non-homologous end joining protein LigD
MLATAADRLPTDPIWTYEVKWDGFRTLAIKSGSTVRLLSRNLKNLTGDYPGIASAIARLKPADVVLDGEIVAIDADGRPSFQALQHRRPASVAVAYYAFDVLQLDGESLLDRPLDERRRRLKALLKSAPAPVLLSEPLPGSPSDIEGEIRRLGLEGVVAKCRDSTYRPGQRSDAWVKVKFSARQEFVMGGYTPAGRNFDSILIGYFQERRLYFAARVRAGFTPHLRGEVFRRIATKPARSCTFVNVSNSSGKSRMGRGIAAPSMAGFRRVKPKTFAERASPVCRTPPQRLIIRDMVGEGIAKLQSRHSSKRRPQEWAFEFFPVECQNRPQS